MKIGQTCRPVNLSDGNLQVRKISFLPDFHVSLPGRQLYLLLSCREESCTNRLRLWLSVITVAGTILREWYVHRFEGRLGCLGVLIFQPNKLFAQVQSSFQV